MAQIIDGKSVSKQILEEVRQEAERMAAAGKRPGLAVIIVGEDPASKVYVRNKERACEQCGFYSEIHRLPEDTPEAELLGLIARLNITPEINGILVQLPLPKHIHEGRVIEAIAPNKDVDAFSHVNVGRVVVGDYIFAPCTPAGVVELIDRGGMDIKGKHCVIIGRSNIVGKPLALLMLHRHATVTICHSRTENLADITRQADILVAAVGRANFVTGDMIKPGAAVIDVGINRLPDGKLCGDVDYEAAEKVAGMITPVPGGVGPMTIAMLMKNTLAAAAAASKGR